MRRSLLKLSLALFLFSMLLPMDMPDGPPFSILDYYPGLFAFLGGFLSLIAFYKTPFLFLAWATNVLLIISYVRGLKRFQRSRTLGIVAVMLAPLPLLMHDPNSLFNFSISESPAFWVWFSAHLTLLVAEFSPFDNPLANSVQMLVDKRPRLIHREEELDQQFQKVLLRAYPEITLKGKGDAWMQVFLNPHNAVAQFFRFQGDPGLFSQSNTPPEEENQVFRTVEKTYRNYPLNYLITHDEALEAIRHYALKGEAGDAFQWQDPRLDESFSPSERPWASSI